MIRSIVAATNKPAACELIISGDVISEGPLQTIRLLTAAPNQFRSADKGSINGAAKRLVPNSGIHAKELSGETPEVDIIHNPRRIVRSRVGRTEVEIGALCDVLIAAQMPEIRQVAALARLEQILAGVSPEDLPRRLQKHIRNWNQPRNGDARIVDAVLPAD